jgi:hypothetical protein
MTEDIMAADVIMTSAAPSIRIRILFSFSQIALPSLDWRRELANHISFD